MCYHVHGICVCAPLQVSKALQWLLAGVARAPGLEPIPGRLGGFPGLVVEARGVRQPRSLARLAGTSSWRGRRKASPAPHFP